MTVSSQMLVEGPVRQAPLFGLFSVLGFRTPAEGDRWEGGVEWEQATCAPLAPPVRQGCGVESSGLPKQFEPGGADLGGADPFSVYGSFECATTDLADGQRIATERLLRGEEAAVTAYLVELIMSLLGAPPSAGEDPAVALGMAETSLSAAGTAGMLIMDRVTQSTLSRFGLVAPEGSRMVSSAQTPVVLSPVLLDPAGLVLAAPLPLAYRSQVFTSSSRPGDLFDRGTNTLFAVAERTYLIGLDRCGVGAAVARLGVATTGGSTDV